MSLPVKKLTIEGFKSIRQVEDFELRPLNVLIGANGAGKSNFVGFFRLLRELIEQRLQETVGIEGGADSLLYLGPKITKRLNAQLHFGENTYEIVLRPTVDNRFVFAHESVFYKYTATTGYEESFGSGHTEAKLKDFKGDRGRRGGPSVSHHVYKALSSWVVYHFDDTSPSAGVRREQSINDNEILRPDAENLAAFLYKIRQTSPTNYVRIRDSVRLAAPFFDDFKLRPVPTRLNQIQLEWLQKDSDYPFRAHQLSDGTLRFICLATALLQPSRPATALFDEPELGLHPYALTLLGNLLRQSVKGTEQKQVIVSTQSVLLLNEFAPEDVIVVERTQGESTFGRLDSADLTEWLEDYGLGELWQKNVLGGRPRPEDTPNLVTADSSGDS